MTPAEIMAAALARSTPASADVDRLRAAEVEAVAEDRAATQDRIRAEKRQTTAHYNLIATRGRLDAARGHLAAHGALIELLNTDPTLIDDLHHLAVLGDCDTLYVTAERMSLLGRRGLIDRRSRPLPLGRRTLSILTATGRDVLALCQEITTTPTTTTED